MIPPEKKLTPKEEADLAKQIESDINDWIEKKHLTEVPPCVEGLCDPDKI